MRRMMKTIPMMMVDRRKSVVLSPSVMEKMTPRKSLRCAESEADRRVWTPQWRPGLRQS